MRGEARWRGALTQAADGARTDPFVYDAAGRMVSRPAGEETTALTWDVTSSLTESDGQGGHVVYAYDASGQRVMQARVADAEGVGTATAYVASGQVDDPDTASTSTGDLSATRYYTFAGSTVAMRTNDGQLALMLGDEQGSTNVVMPVHVQVDGTLASATLADASAVTRTSYTPYGELRGEDNLATDRGWLGQVEDRVVGTGASSTGTGLTYLNARYYDPVTMRFVSPDPLMNPADPTTLDPYRYADNNPVVFTDASGLFAACSGVYGAAEKKCLDSYYKGSGLKPPAAGKVTTTHSPPAKAKPKPTSPSIGLGGTGGVPSAGAVPLIGAASGGSSLSGASLFGTTQTAQYGVGGIFDPGSGNGSSCDTTFECWIDQLKQMSDGSKRILKELGVDGRAALDAGRSGRPVVTVVSHLESFGPALLAAGLVASGLDSYLRIGDKHWRDDLNGFEEMGFVVSRVAAGEGGALIGGTFGGALGGEAGLLCGAGAIACSPAAAVTLGVAGATLGDMAGTYVFDRVADFAVPAYVDWKWW